jgi:hypothetical protein
MKIYGTFFALLVAQTAAFQSQKQNGFKAESLGMLGRDPARVAERNAGIGNGPFSTSSKNFLSNLEQGGESPAQRIWERGTPVTVQGGSLKTWSFTAPRLERVQVVMKTEGRPLDADVELWQGPDNTPTKMRVYVEDGSLRPFSCVIETPRQGPNTIAIRNTANLEFPLAAVVAAQDAGYPSAATTEMSSSMIIQGGALRTYPFEPLVDSVQVMLRTDGRPLNARLELLQGPNNNKQVIELYTEDGMDRPFFAILETPGSGNVVRVVNTATVEFPLTAWVEPYAIGNSERGMDPVLGGDDEGFFMADRRW